MWFIYKSKFTLYLVASSFVLPGFWFESERLCDVWMCANAMPFACGCVCVTAECYHILRHIMPYKWQWLFDYLERMKRAHRIITIANPFFLILSFSPDLHLSIFLCLLVYPALYRRNQQQSDWLLGAPFMYNMNGSALPENENEKKIK